jgi:cytochrome c peroxidase
MKSRGFLPLALAIVVPLAAAEKTPKSAGVETPLGLLPVVWPRDNPYTPAKAELGKLLYFDVRLSADDSVSCASCHKPKFAFTDAAPNSEGIHAQHGNRSAPTVINRAYGFAQFWDGRASSLEEQAKGPMANPIEMGNTLDAVVTRLNSIPGYKPLFEKAFGPGPITIDNAAKAIATYERTVLSGNSAFDRYRNGEKKAMSPAAVHGMNVFYNKAKCDKCHDGFNFTTNDYHNIGVGMDKPNPDTGRYAVTKNKRDYGAFKTPTLRDVALTAPYMHDGSLKTLEEVVDYYDKGGNPNENLDSEMKKLKLSDAEKHDLVEFLKSLSGDSWKNMKPPDSFPQ